MSEQEKTDRERVKRDYLSGMKIKEISEKHNLSVNTLKSWIKRYRWAEEKRGAPEKKRGAPRNNTNAAGAGAPKGNTNAVKHGLFSRCMPDDESRQIFEEVDSLSQLDLLWGNIKLLQTAILRSQKIMYVKDNHDKTVEKVEQKDGNVIGESWEVQQAWDKQGNFLKSLSRAQAELRNLIKQYDEMLHKNWEAASEEQQNRIALVKAQIARVSLEPIEEEDGVEIINDVPQENGQDIGYHNSKISEDI